MRRLVIGTSGLMLFTGVADAGPDWLEDKDGGGDAGSIPGSAQNTTGAGQVRSIAGSLGGTDTEDLYLIQVNDSDTFKAETNFSSDFDTQLWLFDASGKGLLGNNINPFTGIGSIVMAPSTDEVTIELPGPGLYFLGISEVGTIPTSGVGFGARNIFEFQTPTEISGPDGPGGPDPLDSWDSTAGMGGGYNITIVPAPGAAALFGIAGLAACRRRRS